MDELYPLPKPKHTALLLPQLFNRDAKQAEVLLNQQENFLTKEDTIVRLM